MSTKSEQLRELAERVDWDDQFNVEGDGVDTEDLKDAARALREYADRLDAVAVSDAMVESVGKALYIYWDDVTKSAQGKYREKVRAALESILPIADEQMTTRYKWLRNRMTVTEVQELERRGDQSEEAYEAEIDRAIDNAVASAKGDAR